MALNQAQTEALISAVSQMGTDIQELADRLSNTAVADDPTVAQVITELGDFSQRIDALANPETPPTTP